MTEFEVAAGVASLPADQWNALVGEESPFLEWEWLASLEQAGTVGGDTGWDPRPLVARDGGRLIAAAPLYVKLHSEGEFVFDWGWADAAQRAGIRYYPKMLVAVPFSPVAGARLLVAQGANRARWSRRLAEALRDICLENELSGVHVDFCREEELDPMSEAGYLVRIGLQYHWHNRGYTRFEDYLARFRSKRRNQIRRERRQLASQGVQIERLVGDEIPDRLFETMYRFYLTTVERHYWGRRYLNLELFELLRDRFRRRLVFIVARQNGEPVAGTFNVVKGDTLYGRYWGATRQLKDLHFNVCYYAAVEHCIEAGLQRFEPGAGGEYKQLRGFDARPTWSAHFLRDPRLAAAVRQFLDGEKKQAREAIEGYHDRSALKGDPR